MLLFFIANANILQHSNYSGKTILQCDEEVYNMEFCPNLSHEDSKKSRPCSQAGICLPCKDLGANVNVMP